MRAVFRRIAGSSRLLCSSAALALVATPVAAQETKSAETTGIEDIVVTAQRREESVLSVPLSIQALSGDQIANAGIKDITDLQSTAPGFVVADVGSGWQLFIRGIGNAIFVGADPSVATYIDDVPRPYATMVAQFLDVERVEVLKGAQGGLYGRNATGGVVRIISRQPSVDAVAGDFRASYGEKNSLKIAGYLNVPLSDKIAFSIAGERNRHDPYVRNVSTNPAPYTAAMFPSGAFGTLTPQQTADVLNSGIKPLKGYGSGDLWAVKGKVLFQPTDNLKVTLAGDYNRVVDTNGTQGYNTSLAYTSLAVPAFFANFGIQTNFPAGFFIDRDGKFTTAKANDPIISTKDFGTSLTVELGLPGIDLTSISAYRWQKSGFLDNFPSINVPLVQSDNFRNRHFFYQELRAQSATDGPLQYIGGATYMRNTLPLRGVVSLLRPLVVLPESFAKSIVTNWSVYLQLGYDITDNLNLTVSGRYIDDKNDTAFILPVTDAVTSKNHKFVPSATLSYKLDGGGNIYARWAQGYKGGGVNPVTPPSVFVDPNLGAIFGPETVDTFEAGFRAPLFGNRVQVTGAVFYNDYKNLQIVATATPQHPEITFAVVNGGTARTWGVEGSVTWRVIDALTVGATAGYLNAKYKKVGIPTNEYLTAFDLSGTTMLNAPKLQMSFNANLDTPINDDFRLVGNMLVSHLSRIVWAQSAAPGVLPESVEPGYWLVNARLGVRTADDKYGVAIYADNLFNEDYSVAGSSLNTGNYLNPGKPRIVGAEFSVKF